MTITTVDFKINQYWAALLELLKIRVASGPHRP